ncbi:MAG: hypothetical protein P1P88_20795 [Bacteroidales bacterium]|nr:hypothetical protein [Bacteroidales bacterium]
MKKLLVILTLVFISTSLMAIDEGDFIKTKDGTFFFLKVKNTIAANFIGVKSNGEKVKFNRYDVIGYCKDGEQFEKMPVYKNNVLIGEEDFMKVVCYRNGMKLYEYEYQSGNTGKESRRYYVFKDDKFVVEMDYVNRETLTAFFDAK